MRKQGEAKETVYKSKNMNMLKRQKATRKRAVKQTVFNDFDYKVYDKFNEYRPVFNLIQNKSIEDGMGITAQAFEQFWTEEIGIIDVYKNKSKKDKYEAKLCPMCMDRDNTITWNEYSRASFGNTIKNFLLDFKMNKKVIDSVMKLFENQVIVMPEKYKFVIPFVCSYFGDPSQANIIKIRSDEKVDFNVYFLVHQPIDVPYFLNITGYILKDLDNLKN